jgi:hypothetical protein
MLLAIMGAPLVPLLAQSGVVTVRPRFAGSEPGLPDVKATVDRNQVPLGTEIIFTLSPQRILADDRYRVTIFFGDGKRQVLRQAKISHLYAQPGTFTYSILIEDQKRVTATPTPAPAIPGVKLSVSPGSTEVNRQVNFSAELSRRYPNLKYRFVFGDGTDTGWQDNPASAHSYRLANTYYAYVDIGVASNGSVKQSGGSQRQAIQIAEPVRTISINVRLSANPASVTGGSPVSFVAQVRPQSADARYRFDFGDQSPATDWQASSRTSHQYKSAGKYAARVDVRVPAKGNVREAAASDTVTIAVAAEPAGKATVDLKIIPAAVPLGIPVLFQALPTSAPANAVYRFSFGDGSPPSPWSSHPAQSHIYSTAGSFAAFVEMAANDNERGRPSAVSTRKRVEITPIGPGTGTNANQNANRGRNANSDNLPQSNTNSGLGNRNSTVPANSNLNANSANGAGTRAANSNRNVNSNRIANSNSNANPNASINGNSFGNVIATANANSNGNATANATSSNVDSNAAATNRANANAGPESAKSSQSTSAAPQGSPLTGAETETTDWWKYLIIAAIVFFAAYQLSSYLFAPRPTFVPHVDAGDSRVAAGKPLSIASQLDIDPNLRNGEFKIDTQGQNLIRSKRSAP